MKNEKNCLKNYRCNDKTISKNGFEFSLTKEELESERGRMKVAEVLQKHLHGKNQPDLNKPKLAEQLANDISDEIANGTSRDEIEFEKEVKRITQKISLIDTS